MSCSGIVKAVLPRYAPWDVRSQVYADVNGDGSPECVLAVWRPWRDWAIRKWTSTDSPITANQDARGNSAHVAVLRRERDGRSRAIWVGRHCFGRSPP